MIAFRDLPARAQRLVALQDTTTLLYLARRMDERPERFELVERPQWTEVWGCGLLLAWFDPSRPSPDDE